MYHTVPSKCPWVLGIHGPKIVGGEHLLRETICTYSKESSKNWVGTYAQDVTVFYNLEWLLSAREAIVYIECKKSPISESEGN